MLFCAIVLIACIAMLVIRRLASVKRYRVLAQ